MSSMEGFEEKKKSSSNAIFYLLSIFCSLYQSLHMIHIMMMYANVQHTPSAHVRLFELHKQWIRSGFFFHVCTERYKTPPMGKNSWSQTIVKEMGTNWQLSFYICCLGWSIVEDADRRLTAIEKQHAINTRPWHGSGAERGWSKCTGTPKWMNPLEMYQKKAQLGHYIAAT